MQALKEYFKRVFQDMVMMKISLPAIMKRIFCQMLEKLKALNEYHDLHSLLFFNRLF